MVESCCHLGFVCCPWLGTKLLVPGSVSSSAVGTLPFGSSWHLLLIAGTALLGWGSSQLQVGLFHPHQKKLRDVWCKELCAEQQERAGQGNLLCKQWGARMWIKCQGEWILYALTCSFPMLFESYAFSKEMFLNQF